MVVAHYYVLSKHTISVVASGAAVFVLLMVLAAGSVAMAIAAVRSSRETRFRNGAVEFALPALGIGLVLLYGFWSVQWAFSNFVGKFGATEYSFAGNAFVDRATGGRDSAILVTADSAQAFAVWNDIAFNETIARSVQFFGGKTTYRTRFSVRPNIQLRVEGSNGSLAGNDVLPAYLVQTGPGNLGFSGRVVARSPVFTGGFEQTVTRLDRPPRLVWRADRVGADGSLPVGKPVAIDVFGQPSAGHISAGRCFTANVESASTAGKLIVTTASGDRTTAPVDPGRQRAISARLVATPGRQRIWLQLRPAVGAAPIPSFRVFLGDVAVSPC